MNNMETKLRELQELLSSPDRWTQGVMARDINGTPTSDKMAGDPVCWCLLGGAGKVFGEAIRAERYMVTNAISNLCGGGIVPFNDSPKRKHADICSLLAELVRYGSVEFTREHRFWAPEVVREVLGMEVIPSGERPTDQQIKVSLLFHEDWGSSVNFNVIARYFYKG